jgi:uncharacterized protein YjiK
MSYGIIYVLLVAGLACKSDDPGYKRVDYDLDKPDEVFFMDGDLQEISGLTVSGHYLAAVEDENGKLYFLNPQNGKIEEDAKFWKDGDFEGIETVGTSLFALKSNGNLYQVEGIKPDEDDTEKFDLGFSGDDNFEGLGYQPETDMLLLSAKRSPQARKKEIYAISPQELVAGRQARQVHVIDQSELRQYVLKKEKRWIDRVTQRLATAAYSFNPSAIAVHPRTGEIYVLSSPNPQLLVLNKNWKIKALVFLDPLKFKQPEAICFDFEETLFIANEGKDGRANVLKFNKR